MGLHVQEKEGRGPVDAELGCKQADASFPAVIVRAWHSKGGSADPYRKEQNVRLTKRALQTGVM